MGRWSRFVAAVTVVALTLGACGGGDPRPPAAPAPPALVPGAVVEQRYAVGLRTMPLGRGADRPLRTVVLYPAAGADSDPVRRDAAPARGRFPLVLFSHGLHGSPERYLPAASSWAGAGFVVAMPAYPYTSAAARQYRRSDIRNQPADAAYVIDRIRDLDTRPGDPLAGRIDGDHVAAVGHSAGGYTTTGLFAPGHDPRLKAGVVLAGWRAPKAFGGPPASMLFVHGDSDPVVPVTESRAAFAAVPWPRWYVLLPRNHHAGYLQPGNRGFPEVESLVTDFLRWTLTGDRAAHQRFTAMSRR